MDKRLVGAGDTTDTGTASRTPHKGKTPAQEMGTSCTDRALVVLKSARLTSYLVTSPGAGPKLEREAKGRL